MSDNTLGSLNDLQKLLSAKKLPPVHLWEPDNVRDIDIRIARNGDWFYNGSLIQRKRMVKLFSTVLRVDDDEHTYLVTPHEKLRVVVEDAPFTAVLLDTHGSGQEQVLIFTTNTDEQVIADKAHPIYVKYHKTNGEPAPYVIVRDRLSALISRAVFYELAELGVQQGDIFGVYSSGEFMPMAQQ